MNCFLCDKEFNTYIITTCCDVEYCYTYRNQILTLYPQTLEAVFMLQDITVDHMTTPQMTHIFIDCRQFNDDPEFILACKLDDTIWSRADLHVLID